jgi:hypothetical protein
VTFNLLTVRTAQDDDGRLYPILGAQGDAYPFQLEQWDGHIFNSEATGMVLTQFINEVPKLLTRLTEVPVQIYVTESRVIVACEKWNKGDRYWGVGLGATNALISNTVNKVKEARSRRGTMLLGQFRYGWLKHVGYLPKKGVFSHPAIRLNLGHRLQPSNEVRFLQLELILANSVDATSLARDIVGRSAKYRLRYEAIETEAERQKIGYLVSPPHLPPARPKHYATYMFPSSRPADVRTAYPQDLSEE